MKTCRNCGKVIKKRGLVYCGNQCQQDFQYKTYIERWKAGLESGGRKGFQFSSYLRRYLFNKFDNKCCICGWGEVNPFSKTIPLEIDHIDGDSSNNAEENLRLLCPNCHSLTKTYKGANRGNGRPSRKRYNLLH